MPSVRPLLSPFHRHRRPRLDKTTFVWVAAYPETLHFRIHWHQSLMPLMHVSCLFGRRGRAHHTNTQSRNMTLTSLASARDCHRQESHGDGRRVQNCEEGESEHRIVGHWHNGSWITVHQSALFSYNMHSRMTWKTCPRPLHNKYFIMCNVPNCARRRWTAFWAACGVVSSTDGSIEARENTPPSSTTIAAVAAVAATTTIAILN